MKKDLKLYGFTKKFKNESNNYSELIPARVIESHRSLYKIISTDGILTAKVTGKYLNQVNSTEDFPTVGDFVMCDLVDQKSAIIKAILPRESVITRKAAGNTHNSQLIAANVDTLFICMSLNEDLNPRRLERYLSIAWDGGSIPVIVLTKSDLCDDIASVLLQIEAIALGVDIILSNTVENDGLNQLTPYLKPTKTIAFVGSSGVGKSTLINKLIGQELINTGSIRINDGKGRHTTSHRQMFFSPNGTMIIDTPGMRELGLQSVNLNKSFADIQELAHECKFRNCSHTNEPGCAVLASVAAGQLDSKRLANFIKLSNESQYDSLNSREIENKKLERMFGGKNEYKRQKRAFKNKKSY
ncbi:ribosome small subunit-dependent GTPase A [Weissella kandleri]|uniref:ribosome small subunit-dependent GTPase A n=1 Tax=Weissella kandleri TaxID=1616 RepID=UPI00387EB75B